jgi:hypothetical protein
LGSDSDAQLFPNEIRRSQLVADFVSPLLKFRQIGGSVNVGRAFVSAAAFEVKGTE